MGWSETVIPGGRLPSTRSCTSSIPRGYPRAKASRSGGQVPSWNQCSTASKIVQPGASGSAGTTFDQCSPTTSTGSVARLGDGPRSSDVEERPPRLGKGAEPDDGAER